MNSFNQFHKGTCILLDLLFLKHTKKDKNGEGGEKKLEIYQNFLSTGPPWPPAPSRQPVPFYPSSEQLTQLRISFLQDEVPF